MNKFSSRLLLLLLIQIHMVSAAEPLARFPVGDARWTITFGNSAEKKRDTGENRIARAEITRKGGIRQDRIWWSDGKTTEVWMLESAKVRVFENPQNNGVYVVPFDNQIMTDFIPNNFDEDLFSWIAPNYEAGVEKYKDRECRIFAGVISQVVHIPGFLKPEKLPPRSFKAWIDAETRRPVALDNGIAMHEFVFEPVPEEPLVMPERFQSELNRYFADIAPSKRIERLRARNAQPRS